METYRYVEGRPYQSISPLGFRTTHGPSGNTVLSVDARQWPTTYTVDALNRTAQTLYIDATRVTNSWDNAGQMIASSDVTGTYTNSFDLDGRKYAVMNPTGIGLTQTLDHVGNRLVLQDNYGITSYSWDQQNRLLSIWNPSNERTSLTWDNLNREQHRVVGNGMTISHTWDPAGRETVIGNYGPSGVGLAIFTNTYSPVDNRLTVLELDSTRATFTYDASRQIVSEARGGTMAYARSYVWDPMGNRLQQWDSGVLTSGTFNKANQQTLITPATGAPTTQSFDNAGNMTLESTGAAFVTSTWSPENRLVSYVDSKGDSVQSLYSDDGLRRQRTVNSETNNLTYDESVLLLETSTAGALNARYTNYPRAWGGIVSQSVSDATSFFGFDSQGSARILVSVAGVVTDARSWKVFGEQIQPGSGTETPYGYVATAAYYIELADLFNAWNRWLRIATGRWRSVDRIRLNTDLLSTYVCSDNVPTRESDPTGNRQGQGQQVVVGVGKGQNCPGEDAYLELLTLLGQVKNTDCLAAIARVCSNGASGGGIGAIKKEIPQVKFIQQDFPCPKVPKERTDINCSTLMQPVHGAPPPASSCAPQNICFDQYECANGIDVRAGALLFELMNWCNCKYHSNFGGEQPASDVSKACSEPNGLVRFGGGGQFH